jgi:glycosyltransferase involved in cell wall biosynthesis
MRIAIAGQTYYPGNNGQAIFTIHLAEGLARAGHEVHVIVPSDKFDYRCEFIQGVHVHRVRSLNLRWIHPEVFLTFFPHGMIRKIFTEHRPDVVHIQDHYFLCLDTVQVALSMKIPVMGTNHFLPENVLPYLNQVPLPRSAKISVMWSLMLMTYNRLAHVTTPTQTGADILAKTRIRVPITPISCGVDTETFHPAPDLDRAAACNLFGLDPHKRLFVYVGRLDREKRIDLLLKGMARLRDAGRTDLHLAIAGQGAARGELMALMKSLNLGSLVTFLGYVPNQHLPLLYQTAQVFCMPSPEELQSIATLEAMASARPVLAVNARALPELVHHCENGYLFELNRASDAESAQAVADGMLYLADHQERWSEMGEISRARAVSHSLERSICKYADLYQRLAKH